MASTQQQQSMPQSVIVWSSPARQQPLVSTRHHLARAPRPAYRKPFLRTMQKLSPLFAAITRRRSPWSGGSTSK
eukprot:183981-Rhodomonas_salina.1